MSYQDRIKNAVYTSPNGNVFTFPPLDVEMSVDLKTTSFVFSEKDGAYIQHNGVGGKQFPMTLIFTGADHDIEADSFLSTFEERGISKLEHPKYGDRNVVPTGSPTRRDDLITATNQAVLEVVFSETILPEEFIYPSANKNLENQISETATEFNKTSAQEFSDNIQVDSINEQTKFENTAQESVTTIEQLEDTEDFGQVENSFSTLKSGYEETIKDPVSNSTDSASQAVLLTRTPAQINTKISNGIKSYTRQIDSLTRTVNQSDGTNNPKNKFWYEFIQVEASICALCEACTNAIIPNRSEAIKAASDISALYVQANEWIDENLTSLDIINSGDSYGQILGLESLAVSYLINAAFDLPAEKRVVLSDDRNIIEFLTSVGLSINKMDDFIEWNFDNLNGNDFEILPAGKTVVYYE